jgi:hypothetical protein
MSNRFGKWAVGAIAAVAAVGAASTARADDEHLGGLEHRPKESPQRFQLEIRVGLYQPRIDSDPNLSGSPYSAAFGDSARIEIGGELDWQVLRIPYLGSLGPGFGIGYTSMNGSTTFISGKYAGQPSGEDTTLSILPMYAVAVLRVDTFDRNLHIPVVPYAKAGAGFALWTAGTTGGVSTGPNGVTGRGHTFGTHFALGVDLDLNMFDPHAARELDNFSGINHTYLFAEYMFAELTGLGQTHALYVGSRTPVFGLSFDF